MQGASLTNRKILLCLTALKGLLQIFHRYYAIAALQKLYEIDIIVIIL